MRVEELRAILVEESRKLRFLLTNTLLPHQEHPFIASTIVDAKRTGRNINNLLSAIQEIQGKPASQNGDELEMSTAPMKDSDQDREQKRLIRLVIQSLFLTRQVADVMSAGYGYFLCPHHVVNESCRRIAALIAEDSDVVVEQAEDSGVVAEQTAVDDAGAQQKASDAAIFRVLLPEYTITGRQDLLEGIIDEPPIYGNVVYSEQLYTTKTGPVISIPHLFRHDFATILAAFYLSAEQIKQLRDDPASSFHNTTITSLTSVEKAAICNFNFLLNGKQLTDGSKRLFVSLQSWIRAKTNPNLTFFDMLTILHETIHMNYKTYIHAVFFDFLAYWDNLDDTQRTRFTNWHLQFNRGIPITFSAFIKHIREYLRDNSFTTVYWLIDSIDKIFLDVQAKKGDYKACYMKLADGTYSSWPNYCETLKNQVGEAYHLCRNFTSGNRENSFQVKGNQVDEVLTIIMVNKAAGKEAFPFVMDGATSIGLALSQLNPVHYEPYLHTVFSCTGNLFTRAVEFQSVFKFVPSEHLAAACNLLLPFLENYLCLNKKPDERTSNQSFLRLKELARALSVEQLQVVCNAIKDKLPRIISSLNRFNLTLQAVQTEQDKCVVIYNAMKDQLQKPVNGVKFYTTMQSLIETAVPAELYITCKAGNIANIIAMINHVDEEKRTILDNFEGFMKSFSNPGNLTKQTEIIDALFEIIECRYIPIYSALREAQQGIWKTNLVGYLNRFETTREKVEYLLKHISVSGGSRSALAWRLACQSSNHDVELFQKVIREASARNWLGVPRYIANTFLEYSAPYMIRAEVRRSLEVDAQPVTVDETDPVAIAVRQQLTIIRPLSFTL